MVLFHNSLSLPHISISLRTNTFIPKSSVAYVIDNKVKIYPPQGGRQLKNMTEKQMKKVGCLLEGGFWKCHDCLANGVGSWMLSLAALAVFFQTISLSNGVYNACNSPSHKTVCTYFPTRSVHVAPFRHGLLEHSSISVLQFLSVYPSSQVHK